MKRDGRPILDEKCLLRPRNLKGHTIYQTSSDIPVHQQLLHPIFSSNSLNRVRLPTLETINIDSESSGIIPDNQ